MSGIVRALGWDHEEQQRFIAIPPLGDEVVLYETSDDPETLTRVTAHSGFENIQCSAYARNDVGKTGVGQINGVVCIFDLCDPKRSIIRLKPKQSRQCNSLSFNINGLLATGFDKGRQDNSLQIWDVNKSDLNEKEFRPLHTYVPNEAILSTIFFLDSDSTLISGSYKFLRQFDLRNDQPSFQIATKCTLGLTPDLLQPHYFLLYGDDGLVAVWDRRRLTSHGMKHKSLLTTMVSELPVLQFPKLLSDGSRKTLPCLRYSPVRSGEFSLVFSGNLIRRWHTGVAPQSKDTASQARRLSSGARSSVLTLKHQAAQLYKPNMDSLFVSFVLDVKTDYERVILFDYSPHHDLPSSIYFACMRQLGSVFRMLSRECIDGLSFNLYNEITIAGSEGLATHFYEPVVQLKPGKRKKHGTFDPPSDIHGNRRLSASESDLDSESDSEATSDDDAAWEPTQQGTTMGSVLSINEILDFDICSLIRKRAIAGYGLDPETNVDVLATLGGIDKQHFLRNTWRWLTLAHKSLTKGTMISQGLDLGYQGVLGIWNGAQDLRGQRRYAGEVDETVFALAVKAIVAGKGKKTSGISIASNSEKRVQRKLCLIISGWYLADDELDDKLDDLVELGQYEKAAGWAVFHGKVNRAVEILASSKKERLRLVSTAVAGYLAYKDINVNSPWKDQCRRMALEMDNPYLRAIFAFVADSDWSDVLDENSLPLRERLGVALRYLSDKDLTIYLNRIADYVVARGELEGLILTGLTPRGIELLQLYVNRTNDVQTAALISLFSVPRYFVDIRADHWLDCYRSLLNSWGMYSTRARFDVGRTRLSKSQDNKILVAAAPKQVYLQCLKCNKNLGLVGAGAEMGKNKDAALLHFNQRRRGDDNVCPHCRSPLPRCAVCLLTLGTPVPVDLSQKPAENDIRARNQARFRDWFSFCMSCNHGAHAVHAEEWFSKHYVCPVPDCSCRCNSK